ncbi:MAG: PAS domain S-box protein [Flavobacteriales bacterium]
MLSKFNLYFGSSSDAIFLIDANSYKILAINPYVCKLLACAENNLLNQNWWEKNLIHLDENDIKDITEQLINYKNWKGVKLLSDFNGNKSLVDFHINVVNENKKDYFIIRIIDNSESLKAFKQINETNEKLTTILNNIDNVVYNITIDDKGNKYIRYVSPYIEQLFGFSVDEFITLSKSNKLIRYYHPNDLSSILEISKSIKHTTKPIKHTYRFLPGNSSNYIYIEETIIPQFDVNKKHIGNFGIARNVTDEAHYKNYLKESEERYRSLFENNITGVFRTRLNGEMVICNTAFANIFGYKSFEEMKSVKSESFYFSKKERDNYVKKLLKERSLFNYEARYKTKAGKEIFTLNNVYIVKNEKGKDTFIEGTLIDITQTKKLKDETIRAELAEEANKKLIKEIENHKKTQQELIKNQEFTKNMINSSLDMIMATDINNKITQISPSSLLAFGYTKEEMINLSATDLYYYYEDFEKVISSITKHGLFLGEITNIRKDKTLFTSYLSATTIKDNKGNIVGYMGISRDISELKKAEEGLIESEKKFRSLFENMYDAILLLDEKNNFIDINQAARKLFELNENVHTGNLYDFVHPNSLEYCLKYSKILRKEGFIQRFTIQITTAKGNNRFVELSSTAVYEEGKYVGSRDVLRDITKIIESEELVKQQSSKIQSFFENTSNMMMFTMNKNMELTSFNSALIDIMKKHINIDIKNGDKILEYLKPFMNNNKFKAMKEIYLTALNGEVQEFQGSINGLYGKPIWLEMFLTPIRVKGQKIIEIAGLIHEITEKKVAEIKLKKSEEYNKAMINALPDLIFRMTADGYYLDVFYKSEDQLAIKPEKFIGGRVTDLINPELGKQFLKNIKKAVKTDEIIPFEYSLKVNGKQGFFEARYVNINNKEVLVIIRDITEQKTAETKLLESLKEKEILLKEVHHRVKNNLQVISSILNLQSSFVTDKDTISILKEGQNRIKSMSFIHEILYQTKNFSEVNFADYLNNLITNLFHTYAINSSNIKLVKDIDNIRVSLDQAIPCGLIVNEIISNALKYAFPNNAKGEIFLSLKQEHNQIQIRIEDNGIGLPKNFDVENSSSLGLQLVYTLIEQLDGTIKVNSKKGTKYLITFAPAS